MLFICSVEASLATVLEGTSYCHPSHELLHQPLSWCPVPGPPHYNQSSTQHQRGPESKKGVLKQARGVLRRMLPPPKACHSLPPCLVQKPTRYDPVILGMHPQDSKAGTRTDICTPMFPSSIFTRAKKWKQPKHLQTNE